MAGLLGVMATPALGRAPSRSPVPPQRPMVFERPSLIPNGQRLASLSLEEMLGAHGLSGQTALIALDAETGDVIEQHLPDRPLPPASTAKAMTALYAMHTLGHEHSFPTRVLSRGGSISGGTLSGDLILQGSGDPTLDTAALAILADRLVAQGLRQVSGRFVVDATALPTLDHIYAAQPVAAGYNPSLSGLNLNFNRVHFQWEITNGTASLSMDARSDREAPPVSRIRISTAQRDLPVYTHVWNADSERWTVAASALNRSGSRWLPVRLPGLYAGDVLRVLLATRGCRVPEPQLATTAQSGAILAEVRSQPMRALVTDMLRFSTNITAECLGLSATARAGRVVRALSPSAAVMNDWLRSRYGASGLALLDHSGLNDQSTVTVRGMAHFLLAARREGVLPSLLRDHAMRDAGGQPDSDHPIAVQAKTGSLNFVSSLAGYATPVGGRPVVFAIISADLPRRAALSDDDQENPSGTRPWARSARVLQQRLIERWGGLQG